MVVESKSSEQKEEHLKSKTKSCQPRKKTTEVERIFQRSVWNSPKINDILFLHYKQNIIEKMDKRLYPPLPQKRWDLRITKN